MTEIKQAALCICILGAATGLLRMLIPSEKIQDTDNISDCLHILDMSYQCGKRHHTVFQH